MVKITTFPYYEDLPDLKSQPEHQYKIHELEEGRIYKCLLSGRRVLIISKTASTVNYPDGSVTDTGLSVCGLAYSQTTGRYDRIDVWDNMLTDL